MILTENVIQQSAFVQKTVLCDMALWGLGKGKVHPCTGTEALYRPYGP
jgi:hypothetical protein